MAASDIAMIVFFFFQAEDGIRDYKVTGVQTCALPISTQWQSEFELHARAILGLPVDASLRNPGASAVIYGGQDAEGLVFDGVDEALAVPGTDLRPFGKPESRSEEHTSGLQSPCNLAWR